MRENKDFMRFLYAIAVLQMYGFQVNIAADCGGLYKVTVYRLVRAERDAIKAVVFTCLADFPATYGYVADELAKVCEKFIDRKDLLDATRWAPDADLVHSILEFRVEELPASLAGIELEQAR